MSTATAETSKRTAVADATAKGAGVALRRLGRGLRDAPGALQYWVGAHFMDDAILEAAAGDPRTKAIDLQKRIRQDRRAVLATVIIGLVGWLSGGWWPLLLVDACLAVALSWLVWRKTAAVAWAGRAWGVLAATGGAWWLRTSVGVPWALADVLTLAAALGLLIWAASDGDVGNDLPGVEKAPEVKTDTRYNRIVEGLTIELRIKPDDEQIKVIGAGLEPVDKLWSRMRVQAPRTIRTKQIVDAIPGVASHLGIATERLDAVGVDDGTGREIEGVVDIWLASGDQWKTAPEWPLLAAERVSAWDPVPFIVTDRGVPVLAHLMFAIWMLVSKPRHGKTFAQRLLALAAALDPGVDIAVFDFKVGGRDWLWSKRIAIACGFGRSDDTIKAFVEFLRSVLDRAEEMGRLFQALPAELVPGGQLTREACEKEPRLRPLLIFVDEVHHAVTHEKYGKDVTKLMSKIGRELPFLGINLFFATQRADVRTSIPSELRSLAANRVAGKLYTSRDSGDVLGDAANAMGYNAKDLRPVKGLFIVHGADDTSSFDGYTRGRAYLVDNLAAEEIGQRAYELRQKAGVLPAHTQDVEPPPPELLEALAILRDSGKPSIRSEELASLMGTTPQRLLARIGVKSRQEPTDGWCKHVYLDDLERAASGEQVGLRVVS